MLEPMLEPAISIPIAQFRARRDGPEALMQDVVAERIPDLLQPSENFWTAASLPLGAGIPDLLIASYKPQVFALAHVDLSDAQILAYLRAVGRARLDTIAERMGKDPENLSRRLFNLVQAEAVETAADKFFLSSQWRQILPEIITIEVKISNWQKAIAQAARNRIFAHRSFIALPDKVATRIRSEKAIGVLGIGLIGVSEAGSVSIVRKARRGRPTVWTYYYQLASILARNQQTKCRTSFH